MLNKSVKFKTRIWTKLLSLLVVLSMMAGLAGVIGASAAFAGTPYAPTTSMVIKITGPSGAVETDTVTAAEINALPSSSASTNTDFYYSYRDGADDMIYVIASGAPTADILSHYTSITAGDVVSGTVYADGYQTSITGDQLASTGGSNGDLYYYNGFGTTGQSVASIIATESYWDNSDSSTNPPALPTAGEMTAETSLRNFYGQTSAGDMEASKSVYNIEEIDITSSVDPVAATGITLNKSVASVVYNNTLQLGYILTPSTATNLMVTWSSDNTAVATVNQNGLVTGVASGTAVITATTANGLTATCDVTVTGAPTNCPTTFMIISVNNGAPIFVTDAQILALNPANTLSNYSSTSNSSGQPWLYTGLGAPLASILAAYANLTYSEAQDVSATFTGSDGYSPGIIANYTLCQTRYYYPGSGSPVQVYPSIAAEDYPGITTDYSQLSTSNDGLRLFFGQTSASDGNNKHDSVYDLEYINVFYNPAPSFTATAEPGSVAGTTAVEATPSSGDYLAYLVSGTSMTTPNVGDPLPSTATSGYQSGTNISGVSAGDYVGVYE